MERVIEILPTEAQFKRVVLDFGAATWKACRQVLPGVKLEGCAFHWSQRFPSDPVLWSFKRLSRRPCSPPPPQETDGTPLPTIRIRCSSIQYPEERKKRPCNKGVYDLCTQYMD